MCEGAEAEAGARAGGGGRAAGRVVGGGVNEIKLGSRGKSS